jgi:hypothetical protein
MDFIIKNAKYLKDYKVLISLSDGDYIADFKPYLYNKDIDGTVFEPLRHIDFFKKVKYKKTQGTLAWPNDIDICPDTIKHLIKKPFKSKVESRYIVISAPQILFDSDTAANPYIYPKDTDKHNIPHLHILTTDGNAVIDIKTFKILEIGKNSQKIKNHVSRVLRKLNKFKSELNEAWQAAVVGQPFFKIQPKIATVFDYDIYIYPGDLKQRLVPFVRCKKNDHEIFISLDSTKRGKNLPKDLVTWVDLHTHELYGNWSLALLNEKMKKVK